MTTKVVGATEKPVSVDKVAPAKDAPKEIVQKGEDTAEAKVAAPAKKAAARKQFKKADAAADARSPEEIQASLAVRGY